jgi:type I restriction enzyme M protein
LPHGVLFRGNAEADIRKNLIQKGYIKGIIGLPPNLFYGTGIPACIVVIDKREAMSRQSVFMIDASAGFIKDGAKNRLRAQDLHRIVDTFLNQTEIPRYSRNVSRDEIEKNDFNLNLPRYIDSQTREDVENIEGHLLGGIPTADVDALDRYWAVCPNLRKALFKNNRNGFVDLRVESSAVKAAIYEHPEFATFIATMNAHFDAWRQKAAKSLKALAAGCKPKQVIGKLADGLLDHYVGRPLIDAYDVYQHLMDYWAEAMQDDTDSIAIDGWKAQVYRVLAKDKKGKVKDKGWACDLIPKPLVVARYFAARQAEIDTLAGMLESATAAINEMEEEHGGEDGVFADLEKVNLGTVKARLKELARDGGELSDEEAGVLKKYLTLSESEAKLKRDLATKEDTLDKLALDKYPTLTEPEIKALVIDDKWLAVLDARIHGEMDRVSQALTTRVKELAERYVNTLPALTVRTHELEAKVTRHLERMGFGV